ncbi:hypothetical protein [Frondihabitans sp. PAMC 28766]|uniref:hypothetical protein n=1 Tax=Frondihabitans sp. PAMC 28766 TaxID=1795630 RepID=UPI0012FF61BC|nr:hypothetical protein [Frondihabitans sp. PAMC 28766]
MSDPRERPDTPVPVPTSEARDETARRALPPEAFSTKKPVGRYPGRTNPRKGDMVLTIILSVVLYALVVQYVGDGASRGAKYAALTHGVQLGTILAIAAPLVLALFSTVFSILFILRRVYAFWLPVFAGVLIVALYSITQQMLDQSVITSFSS